MSRILCSFLLVVRYVFPLHWDRSTELSCGPMRCSHLTARAVFPGSDMSTVASRVRCGCLHGGSWIQHPFAYGFLHSGMYWAKAGPAVRWPVSRCRLACGGSLHNMREWPGPPLLVAESDGCRTVPYPGVGPGYGAQFPRNCPACRPTASLGPEICLPGLLRMRFQAQSPHARQHLRAPRAGPLVVTGCSRSAGSRRLGERSDPEPHSPLHGAWRKPHSHVNPTPSSSVRASHKD